VWVINSLFCTVGSIFTDGLTGGRITEFKNVDVDAVDGKGPEVNIITREETLGGSAVMGHIGPGSGQQGNEGVYGR
jgi:hypothetical protein